MLYYWKGGIFMGIRKSCSLCGERLDSSLRCTACGLDNTKNDDMYKHMINKNDCQDLPLTHVHEHKEPSRPKKQKKKPTVVGTVISIIILFSTIVPAFFSIIDEIGFGTGVYEELEPDYTYTPMESYEYEYWLSTGFYEVGVHLPAGWCQVALEDGEWVQLRNYVLDGDELVEKDSCYLHSGEYCEFYLEEGDFFMVESMDDLFYTSVWLYTDSSEFQETVIPEVEGTCLISGECVAGKDFPAGVYDIMYAPNVEGECGDVVLWMRNPEQSDYMLVTAAHFECYDSSFDYSEENIYGYYVNVPLTPETIVDVDDGLGNIYLVPSYETSQETYDITWGAEAIE